MQDRKTLKQELGSGLEQGASHFLDNQQSLAIGSPKEGSITRTTTRTKKNGPSGVIACAKVAMLPKNKMLTLVEHQNALGAWLSFCRNPRVRPAERKIRAPFRAACLGFVIWLGLAFWGSGLVSSWAAAPTNSVSRNDYTSFKLVNDRNIFNTRRSRSYVASDRRETRRTRSESFALVGTMRYEKGLFAFFDGTRSDYRKVLKQDDTIAGFKITTIEPSHVILASATNELDLGVGKQLRREDEGEWRMSDRPEVIDANPVIISSRQVIETGTNRPVEGAEGENVLPDGVAGLVPPFVGDAGPDAVGTNTPAATLTGGNDAESVLERLRRRREQESQ